MFVLHTKVTTNKIAAFCINFIRCFFFTSFILFRFRIDIFVFKLISNITKKWESHNYFWVNAFQHIYVNCSIFYTVFLAKNIFDSIRCFGFFFSTWKFNWNGRMLSSSSIQTFFNLIITLITIIIIDSVFSSTFQWSNDEEKKRFKKNNKKKLLISIFRCWNISFCSVLVLRYRLKYIRCYNLVVLLSDKPVLNMLKWMLIVEWLTEWKKKIIKFDYNSQREKKQ